MPNYDTYGCPRGINFVYISSVTRRLKSAQCAHVHNVVGGVGSRRNILLPIPSAVMPHFDPHNHTHAIVKSKQYVFNLRELTTQIDSTC
jgi:hypothetical protein